jgi:hypothetical protein
MKIKNDKKGKSSHPIVAQEKLIERREAIKKIKYIAISAATLMVLMPSKAKADTSQLPGNPW